MTEYFFETEIENTNIEGFGFSGTDIDISPIDAAHQKQDDSKINKAAASPMNAYLDDLKGFSRISLQREQALGKRIKKGQEIILARIFNYPMDPPAMIELNSDILGWLDRTTRPYMTGDRVVRNIVERVAKIAAKHPKDTKLLKLSKRLSRRHKDYQSAHQELVTANLRLAINIARKYQYRGLSLPDLIQEGNIGLIKAAGKFDYETGNRFSTYASWWIRQSVTRAIYDHSRTIRIPVHVVELRNFYFKTYHSLINELNREPSMEEIAESMEVSLAKIHAIRRVAHKHVSLDLPVGEDGLALEEYIPGDDGSQPLQDIYECELTSKIQNSLTGLSKREAEVVQKRFGLNGEEEQTLDEIGSQFNLSRERIRQIETNALFRLRHPSRKKLLRRLLSLG